FVVIEESTEIIFFRRWQIKVEFGFVQHRALGWRGNIILLVVLQQGIGPVFVVILTFAGLFWVNEIKGGAAGIAQAGNGFIQFQFKARGRPRLFFRRAQIEIDKGIIGHFFRQWLVVHIVVNQTEI